MFVGTLQGYPTSQSLVYGYLSSSEIGVNPYLHQGTPNLFGLPASLHAGTVPTRAPYIAPTAAAHARSALTASVDKSGSDTVLQDQRLANYEPRLRQESLVSPTNNAMTGPTTCTALDMVGWLNQGQRASMIHSQWENLPVLGRAIRKCATQPVCLCQASACWESVCERGHFTCQPMVCSPL